MRWRAVVLGSIAIGSVLNWAGPPALAGAAEGEELYGCDRTIGQRSTGSLTKRIDPAPGTFVEPGDIVSVTLTWTVDDWSKDELHKVLDCVAIDGALAPELQGGESPTENDGRFTYEYAVPSDLAPGARVCDQAMLSGPGEGGAFQRHVSEMLCLVVGQPGTGGDQSGPGLPVPAQSEADVQLPSPPPQSSPAPQSSAWPAPPTGASQELVPSVPLAPSVPGAPSPPGSPSVSDTPSTEVAPLSKAPPIFPMASVPTEVAPLVLNRIPGLARTGGDPTVLVVTGLAALSAGGALLAIPRVGRRRKWRV
ncbi:MAG: hypothetical protein ACRDV9_02025 [Acidimicrobiia bacterium]